MIIKYSAAALIAFSLAASATTYALYVDNRKLTERNSALTQTVELVAQREAKAHQERQRLQQVLDERQLREAITNQRTQQLREQINALSSDCTLSTDASGVLQQIYERHRTM